MGTDVNMNTDDFHTTALERSVAALLANDHPTLQHICDMVNQSQLNMCLIPTALSSSVECLNIVVSPLQGQYNSSLDCLNILQSEEIDEERLKVLLPFADPSTVHNPSQNTLWSIALLMDLPLSFYQNWTPQDTTVAQSLPMMKNCSNLELLRWCVEKSTHVKNTNWVNPAWQAARQSQNFAFLNLLASHITLSNRWIDEVNEHWEMWQENMEKLQYFAHLAALVVAVAVGKNDWKTVHTLIKHTEKLPLVTNACVNTGNIFVCHWAFSHGFVLSSHNLWEQIANPNENPLQTKTLAFFKSLLECDQKWNMGAWEQLKHECGANELFCQLLMHGEDAADILRSEVDPEFGNGLPLRLAAMLGRGQTVEQMLPHCDPQTRNSQALALATLHGHADVVTMLLPHSDPSADDHRALACALWCDRQNKTNLSPLLITAQTAPQQTVERWAKRMSQHPDKTRYLRLFEGLRSLDDSDDDMWGEDPIEDQMQDTLKHIFDDIEEDDEDVCVVYGNTMFECTKTYPMSWSNFDQPIENWWSSLGREHLYKIANHLAHVFPDALKKHLCDTNEKSNEPQKRKI